MNLYSFSVLCFSFGVLLVTILTLIKRKDSVSYRYLIFSITVIGWGFLFSQWINQQYSREVTLWLARISYFFVVFIPITWLDFVFHFIEEKGPPKIFYKLNYGISFFFALFCPTKWIFADMAPFIGFKYMPVLGSVHHLHVLHFFTLVSYGLFRLLKAYYKAEGYRKSQLRYFVWGALIGFVAGSSIYFPFYGIPLPLYLLVLMPLYPIFTGIALIRYGLFDVQQIADAFQREKLAVLGTMAASLNHELRNPFYIAKGKIESHLDAIDRGLYPKEEKTYGVLNTSLEQLTRAMEIMQRFSDFSKPFNRNADKEKLLLKDVFEDVLKLVSNEFQLQKIKLNNEATDGIVIYANRRQLEEIFFNLIINACHAMEERGGELFIKAAQPNGKVLIEISDTGPGIPEENQRRIFDPFFSTKGEKGSGLGLYITRQLVEKNGGKISVKSKPGCGTSFNLVFPG